MGSRGGRTCAKISERTCAPFHSQSLSKCSIDLASCRAAMRTSDLLSSKRTSPFQLQLHKMSAVFKSEAPLREGQCAEFARSRAEDCMPHGDRITRPGSFNRGQLIGGECIVSTAHRLALACVMQPAISISRPHAAFTGRPTMPFMMPLARPRPSCCMLALLHRCGVCASCVCASHVPLMLQPLVFPLNPLSPFYSQEMLAIAPWISPCISEIYCSFWDLRPRAENACA